MTKSSIALVKDSDNAAAQLAEQEARGRLRILQTEMARRVVMRDQEIRGLILGSIARQHVCLLGDPGTGKSYLARVFAAGLGLHPETRGDYFELLLTKTTKDTEVLGAWKLEDIKRDIWDRKLEGKLAGAKVGFLDEVFKGSSVILNSLLTVMNERLIHQDSGAVRVPLRVLIGASNELPGDDDGLSPFWDRFVVRYWFEPISGSREGFEALSDLQLDYASGKLSPMPSVATCDDLDLASASAGRVVVPKKVQTALFAITNQAREEGIPVSDRKLGQAQALLKANAWLDGLAEVTLRHLAILGAVFWDSQDQRPKIEAILAKYVRGPLDEVEKSLKAALQICSQVPNEAKVVPQAIRDDATKKIERVVKELDLVPVKAIRDQVDAGKLQPDPGELARLDEIEAKISEEKKRLRTIYGELKFSSVGF